MKTKRQDIQLIMFLIFLTLVIVLVNVLPTREHNNLMHNEFDLNVIKRVTEFSQDSAWISNFNSKNIFNENELNNILSRYNRLINNSSISDSIKHTLINELSLAKVTVKTGKIILDEFTEDTIRKDIRNSVIKFGEYLKQKKSGKYEIKSISKGYLNSINRKADKLYIKYFWDKNVCLTVAQKVVTIGMNKQMVIEAWGQPYDKHRTVTSYGVSEQWVYSSHYVYFEDGLVTTIQN